MKLFFMRSLSMVIMLNALFMHTAAIKAALPNWQPKPAAYVLLGASALGIYAQWRLLKDTRELVPASESLKQEFDNMQKQSNLLKAQIREQEREKERLQALHQSCDLISAENIQALKGAL